MAAKLGDADAQHDLGFCLANGKGCKKDRKEAAKWHRAAVRVPLDITPVFICQHFFPDRLLKGWGVGSVLLSLEGIQ